MLCLHVPSQEILTSGWPAPARVHPAVTTSQDSPGCYRGRCLPVREFSSKLKSVSLCLLPTGSNPLLRERLNSLFYYVYRMFFWNIGQQSCLMQDISSSGSASHFPWVVFAVCGFCINDHPSHALQILLQPLPFLKYSIRKQHSSL